MSVSVVIPVFNGEDFVIRAIKSALQCAEVSEVVVVDDGSKDNTVKVINEYSFENKVKLIQHVDKVNKGVSASRNLGVEESVNEFIAFLDADDVFLKERFEKDLPMLKSDVTIGGVYGALGFDYLSESGKEKYNKKGIQGLTTVSSKVSPEYLPYVLLGVSSVNGYFSGIAFTMRKDVFLKIGGFNEKLSIGEDTELWIKLSLSTKLLPGQIKKPIALRGVHDHNTIVNDATPAKNKVLLYTSLNDWVKEKNVAPLVKEIIENLLFTYQLKSKSIKTSDVPILRKMMSHPRILFHSFFIDTYTLNKFDHTFIRFSLRIKNKLFNLLKLTPTVLWKK